MVYVRIAHDTLQPGTAEKLLVQLREGLLPLLQAQPGFVSYDVVRTGENTAMFIHACETHAQAEAAIQHVSSWVRENVAAMIASVDLHVVGEVVVTSRDG